MIASALFAIGASVNGLWVANGAAILLAAVGVISEPDPDPYMDIGYICIAIVCIGLVYGVYIQTRKLIPAWKNRRRV